MAPNPDQTTKPAAHMTPNWNHSVRRRVSTCRLVSGLLMWELCIQVINRKGALGAAGKATTSRGR